MHFRTAFVLACLAGGAQAQPDTSVSGRFDFGARHHFNDGLYAGQSDAGLQVFVGLEVEAAASLGPGTLTFQIEALQDTDNARAVLNLKRAHYTQSFDSWDVLVGVNIENWGIAESQSVLNVLNPRDGTDTVYGGDLIGTPMINANAFTAIGTFSAYLLPYFVPPNLPKAASRQRALWPTAAHRARFEEGQGRNLDLALRWTQTYPVAGGGLDLSAAYFSGTSRTPVTPPGCAAPEGALTEAACRAINDTVVSAFEAGIPAQADPQDLFDLLNSLPEDLVDAALAAASALPSIGFIPYYQKVQQAGFGAAWTRGDLQLRTELAYTEPRSEEGYWSGVIGGDYSFHGLGPSDGSLTLVVEYLWDDRRTRTPASLFENDVFLGLNLFLNDRRATAIRAGGFYDLDSHAQLYQISASTRINDQVRLELNALHVQSDGYADPLSFIDNDNFLELKLSTYF